jgi:hypothetical protein
MPFIDNDLQGPSEMPPNGIPQGHDWQNVGIIFFDIFILAGQDIRFLQG